jgi:hypothetical protein
LTYSTQAAAECLVHSSIRELAMQMFRRAASYPGVVEHISDIS